MLVALLQNQTTANGVKKEENERQKDGEKRQRQKMRERKCETKRESKRNTNGQRMVCKRSRRGKPL